LAALARRLTDMRTYQLPRLLACPGPLALHQQYASELREDLEGVLRGVRALELLVEGEEDDGREALAGQLQLGQLRAELDRLKRDARAAVLQSKRAIEAKSTRAELLAGAAPDSALDKCASPRMTRTVHRAADTRRVARSADALTNTSNEVTLALRRTMAAMQQEVERSVLSTQLLDASSRTLHAASHSYLSLTTLLNTSRTLITALERADWMDRALIFAALAFFLLVLAFILKQRIFDRGVRLAFWWLRFLP
ncbi:Sec20-domain-containing protein, partial [Calocera cornea HHB12733]